MTNPGLFDRIKIYFFGAPKADSPPHLPTRCGTFLMHASAADVQRTFAGWRQREEDYIAWVEQRPNPNREWRDTVAHLRKWHADEDARICPDKKIVTGI
ncbi:MAG: hypothetical protein K2X44_04695 [Magnetospirillum sp.]|nr:hypothetical protein [Magnetospirillum sp.]